MEPLADLFLRNNARLEDKLQQVFIGTYEQPVGSKLGKVLIGRCGQAVDAARFSNHSKGDTVMVVGSNAGTHQTGWSILPAAPPGKPGPASVATLRTSGQVFEAPPPAGVPPVGPLVMSWGFGTPLTLTRTLFTETPFPVVNSPVSSQTVDLLTTSGSVMVQGMKQASMLVMSGNDFALDTIQEIAYADLSNELGRYELVTNGTNIGGDARHSIFPPTELNTEIYWVEIVDSGSNFSFNLCRVQPGSINTSKVVDRTITRAKTEISTLSTVQDLHFPIMNPSFTNTFSVLFIFGGRWHMFGALRWFNGTSYVTDSFKAIFEGPGPPGDDFLVPTDISGLVHPTGVLLPGIIDGNRTAMTETDFPNEGSYNMRLNDTLTLDPFWASFVGVRNCSIESLNGSFMVTWLTGGARGIVRGDPEGSDFTERVVLDMGAVPGNHAHGLWL